MATNRTAIIIGFGPGLGMSMARHFGARGYRPVLISRTGRRQDRYIAELAAEGIEAAGYTADVTDHDRLREVLREIGPADFVYYGPAPTMVPGDITELNVAGVRDSFEAVYPAVATVEEVLPGLLSKPGSGLMLAGGLSSVTPMPGLGALTLLSAAMRNYALNLHAALAPRGVYAGTLTIGGLIERGDIHTMVTGDPDKYGFQPGSTLDPDAIATTAWDMFQRRDRAEEVFDVMSPSQ